MTVYVDNMKAPYGRLKMCHMVADSTAELMAMAETIGVSAKHIQDRGSYREHFDIAMSKRKLAVEAGAVEISRRELGLIMQEKREEAKHGT